MVSVDSSTNGRGKAHADTTACLAHTLHAQPHVEWMHMYRNCSFLVHTSQENFELKRFGSFQFPSSVKLKAAETFELKVSSASVNQE